jgi:hypothetical protein
MFKTFVDTVSDIDPLVWDVLGGVIVAGVVYTKVVPIFLIAWMNFKRNTTRSNNLRHNRNKLLGTPWPMTLDIRAELESGKREMIGLDEGALIHECCGLSPDGIAGMCWITHGHGYRNTVLLKTHDQKLLAYYFSPETGELRLERETLAFDDCSQRLIKHFKI